MNVLNLEHISKTYGEKVIFDDISFGIHQGDKIGIIGINGTGKTTFLRILAGFEETDEGQVVMQNGLRITYLPQHPEFPEGATILSYVTQGQKEQSWNPETEAHMVLNKLGIEDHEEEIAHLSGGQKKRVALAAVLVNPADVLILDEPTNHLDNEMASWLEDYLNRFKGVVIMVTHDRYFLDRVTNKILEISHGKIYTYEAKYSDFLEMKAQREEMEMASERKKQSILRMEVEWAKRGCRARSTKQRARLDRLEAMKNSTAPVRDKNVEIDSVETRMGKKTIELENITKAYDGITYIRDFSYIFLRDDRIGIIGRNGCGKTTLLRLIAGDIEMSNLDSDETCGITMSGKQNIGFLRQINFTDGDVPVKEELEKAFSEVFACEARKKEIEKLLAETEDHKKLLAEYDFLERRIESLHGYSWKKDMETMFQKFGFALEDLEKPIGEFSGGQQTKIALIQLLLQRPDILLLDEPTNHLDIAAVEWLENYLKSYENAVIIVSHDRMFLDRVIDVTYEIEYGDIKRYPGNYSAFVKQKEEAQIKQEKDYEAQQKEIERLTAWIEKWKNTPTKVAATRSKRMAIEHMVKIEKPRRFDTRTFHALFHPVRESYTDVLTMKKLKIGYDTVLSEVSAVIKKAERIVIIGENGKGKSTLLKTVVGEINPLGGSYQFGNRVDFAYFDQHKAVNQKFDPEQTVLDYFWSLYPNLLRNDVRSALGAFLFSGEDVEKKMGQLSGGEKVRLELCRIFYTKPNFLILDEPTNHMDLAGKEALEKMLTSYEGTVLFVSHDRYFINQVATGILEFGESDVQFYEMNYAQYLEEIKRQTPGRETGNAGGAVRKPADVPTLDDVFDKKKYYNPGKILSRLKRQLEKYEEQLAESESRMSELQLEMMDPELSADYERLMELQTKIDEENQTQESLLERMMETELELEEMETQDE